MVICVIFRFNWKKVLFYFPINDIYEFINSNIIEFILSVFSFYLSLKKLTLSFFILSTIYSNYFFIRSAKIIDLIIDTIVY